MKDIIEKARSILFSRQRAYQHTFKKEDLFTQEVLKDLAAFCRSDESTFHSDPRIHAVLEGRREVYLRISQHINLSSEDLWKKYSKKD